MFVALDIGGTTIKAGLFKNDELVLVKKVKTNGDLGCNAILSGIYTLLDELVTSEVVGIGVSSAGNINPHTGECVYATDILKGYTGIKLKEILEKRYQKTVVVDNDAIMALCGEASYYPKCKNIVMLTIGTGLGGASMIDNKIVYGSNYTGMRWGHMILSVDGKKCSCGHNGCAEAYISATAIIRDANQAGLEVDNAYRVFQLYEEGNIEAIKIIENFMKYLNNLLISINSLFGPELIILGGGVSLSQTTIKALLDSEITNVTFAKLKDLSALYGAKEVIKNVMK